MFLLALDRKLLRETRGMLGQIATIAIVLAAGITCFIALRGTYESLEDAREAYYDRYRLAHVFATLERAPESLAPRIEALPGVARAQTRIVEEVTLPMEGMDRPAYARILSLPAGGDPATNAVSLIRGTYPARGRDDEVLVLGSFAEAHGFRPGDHVPAVINGKLRDLRVVGLAQSPEFVYAIRAGAMVDDPQRYAILWMERTALASAFQLSGAFNDVTLRLQPGASEVATLEALDRLLVPYGGNGAFGRRDQVSNRILTGELAQLSALAGMVPLVFLGVAAFLINIVLGRLITLQRPEIAALKAVGYTNRELAAHYLWLVALVMVPGALLGVLGGAVLGHIVLGMYASIFRFPSLAFHLSGSLVASAVLVSVISAVCGALLAVRAAVKLAPAEAMRPPSPARFRRSFLERMGLGVLAGPTGMMVLREVTRRPLRTALSSVGIAGAVALLILGRFGLDSLDHYLEGTFLREQHQDLAVAFVRPLGPRAVSELAGAPGVVSAEAQRAVPVRIRNDHRRRDTVLIGLPAGASLRRLVEKGGHEVDVPADGVLMTTLLGELLGLRVGDRVDLELREGKRVRVHPVIAGFVDESVGLMMYARTDFVARLEGDLGAVSSVLLDVDPQRKEAVEARLRKSPRAIDISDVPGDVQRLRDMNGSMMDIWVVVSTTLGACVIFGVVYNNARIAFAVRSRELSSLRVLGFSRAEISRILIGGLVVEVLLGIPIGLMLGRFWAQLFMSSVDQEMFRWAVVVNPSTYAFATAVALLASAASALLVRRGLDRLDLIGVLKTRE
jgi:putative ABC transport system permease protein